jgi:hypothetical protein
MTQPTSLMKNEVPRQTKFFREWDAVNTQASRSSIPKTCFYNLENMIPIGNANLHSVPNISASLHDYAFSTVYWSQYVNLGAGLFASGDLLINLTTDGRVFAYNVNTGVNIEANDASTRLSGSGSRLAQWKNSIILFIDSTGYYYWDGATFAKLGGANIPTSGDDIAVAFNRVWIVQGRVLRFSGVDGFGTGVPAVPDATDYWAVANGAGAVQLTDPTIRSPVIRLIAQNGYLYLVGASYINAISDVYVPTGAVPPTPVFTNLNIQALIGTDMAPSLHAYDRLLMFANRYGCYSLYGVSAIKKSDDIDGTWQYLDFSQAISGGAVLVSNILCSAFLIKRNLDPVFGSNTVLALWFPKKDGTDKWWFGNFGALTFIVSAMKGPLPSLYGFIGNKLYQLFADLTTAPAGQVMGPLWDMDDPLADKQCIREGFEVTVTASGPNPFTMTLDTVNNQSAVVTLNTPALVSWINNSSATVLWQNNALAIVGWYSGAFLLYSGDEASGYQKYVGLTVNTGGAVCQFSAMFMDYKLRARWQP